MTASLSGHVVQALKFSCDWPIVHGVPQWLPAYIYIPAEAKTLPVRGHWLLCNSASSSVYACGVQTLHMCRLNALSVHTDFNESVMRQCGYADTVAELYSASP